MCLIIYRPETTSIPVERLETVYDNNSDGLGVMFMDGDSPRVERTLPKTYDDVRTFLAQFGEREMGIHFRYRTHGDISIDQVHPHTIFAPDETHQGLYLMHNGIIRVAGTADTFTKQESDSDTAKYVKNILRPIFEVGGEAMVDSPHFLSLVGRDIGSGNKLLLMRGDGKFYIVNRSSGDEKEVPGVWLSNTYSLNENYRTAKSTYSYKSYNHQSFNGTAGQVSTVVTTGATKNTKFRPILRANAVNDTVLKKLWGRAPVLPPTHNYRMINILQWNSSDQLIDKLCIPPQFLSDLMVAGTGTIISPPPPKESKDTKAPKGSEGSEGGDGVDHLECLKDLPSSFDAEEILEDSYLLGTKTLDDLIAMTDAGVAAAVLSNPEDTIEFFLSHLRHYKALLVAATYDAIDVPSLYDVIEQTQTNNGADDAQEN